MEINCVLNGDYRDIRLLRKLKGYSIRELSEMIFRTESYVTQLENGKINLTTDMYNLIINLLEFDKTVRVSFSISEIQKNTRNKGAMYIKNSNKEIAKQIILNHIEKRKEEWCIEGISACLELIKLIDAKNPIVEIKTNDYVVYDGTDCGNYDYPLGHKFIIDIELLVSELINDSEKILDALWSIPTIDGEWIDIYLIL